MDLVIHYAVYASTVQFSDSSSVKFPWSIFIAGKSSIFGIISCGFYLLFLRSWLRVRRLSEYYQGTEELPSDRFLISETLLVRSSHIVREHSKL